MAPRIFVTGVSGYVGGHSVDRLSQSHPEYHVVALVRDKTQAEQVTTKFPNLETVLGDLDSHEALVKEASKADVILRIISETPNGIGKPSSKVYSDIRDIREITSFDDSHLHRNVDDAVLSTGSQYSIPTAILCAPTIIGVGHGPVKKRSIQVPMYIEAVINNGRPFTLGDGQNIWDHVNVTDLADAFIKLTEEALKPHGGDADWGVEGYYFCEDGEHTWGDFHKKIAEILYAKGTIKSPDLEEMTAEGATKIHPWGPILWGGNARSRAERLRKLGWMPKMGNVDESLVEMVDYELESARKAA